MNKADRMRGKKGDFGGDKGEKKEEEEEEEEGIYVKLLYTVPL